MCHALLPIFRGFFFLLPPNSLQAVLGVFKFPITFNFVSLKSSLLFVEEFDFVFK